jgi:signal transduction histidine kinase
MAPPLRILLVEGDPQQTQLIQDLLKTKGIVSDVVRVDTEAGLRTALQRNRIDLVLANYALPLLEGLSALKLTKRIAPEVPFIFVTTALDEEAAIEALKMGATDYVLKTRLSRLVLSVKRALREVEERTERKRAEEALQLSESYLAEGQRLSHAGSFGWSVVTGQIHWSEETFRIFEYDPTTKPTLQMVVERIHPADRANVSRLIERVSVDGSGFDIEHRLLMPDRRVKFVRVVAHPRRTGEQGGDLLVGAVTDITESKRTEEVVLRAERTRLARDLHDSFLQTIQGCKMVADNALKHSMDTAHVNRAVEDLSVWLGQAMCEARTALHSLRTTGRGDLVEALQRATEGDLLPSRMAVTFSVHGEVKEMHPLVGDEVYCIAYEAIRNACRHSGASRLEVQLNYARDLTLRLTDNGVGIDPQIAATGRWGHFGLQGMRERAIRIRSKLIIDSSAKSGTGITLVVPGSVAFRKASANWRTLLTKIRNLLDLEE